MAKFTNYKVGETVNPFRLMGNEYDRAPHALVMRSPNQKMRLKIDNDLVGFHLCRQDGTVMSLHAKRSNPELEIIQVEEIDLWNSQLCLPAELIASSDGLTRIPQPLICQNLRQAWELSDEGAEPFVLLPPDEDASERANLIRLNKLNSSIAFRIEGEKIEFLAGESWNELNVWDLFLEIGKILGLKNKSGGFGYNPLGISLQNEEGKEIYGETIGE